MRHDPEMLKEPIILSTHIRSKSSQTLLEFLAGRFHYHGREEWKSLIGQGRVTVNGLAASAGQSLRAGDEVAYETAAWKEPQVNPRYRMVYEDEVILALSKPAPLPVHAIGAYFKNTLMYLLRRDRPEARGYHLVHRLDSETSGLLLLVKDKKYLKQLQKQWRGAALKCAEQGEALLQGSVHKTYEAIVFGKFPDEIRLEANIGPKTGSRVRMKMGVVGPFDGSAMLTTGITQGSPRDGARIKTSVTEFKRIGTRSNFSLVEAKPLTGRTHQIRLHLEHLGHPVVGDKLYSGNDEVFLHFHKHGWDEWIRDKILLPRLALHALELEFTHPETGKRMTLEDPLPQDLLDFWNSIPN
jgi:23S rRNA pseudouridine1911/1915/1917 synthase